MRKISWFDMLIYRLFYWRWDYICYRRPELWDKIRGDPARPLPLTQEWDEFVKYRYGRCKGCEWHPDVCDHCLRSEIPDFDEPA